MPQPFNIWMNIPVHADGSIDWLPTVSETGDQVTLRAEMDLVPDNLQENTNQQSEEVIEDHE